MTTVMAPRRCATTSDGGAPALAALIGTRAALALSIDDRGEIRLGMRAYTAVRIGSERIGDYDNPLNYPVSGAGHLRQNRYFLQLSYDHDLTRLVKESCGLLAPFRLLDPTTPQVHARVPLRGREASTTGARRVQRTSIAALARFRGDFPNGTRHPRVAEHQHTPKLDQRYIEERVDRLRRNARVRNRLFLAYLDFEKGPFFLRVGRQVLAWGETDVFRLLDNINPLDDSFGGFFIALDERRVPIAMARGSWQLGLVGAVPGRVHRGLRRRRATRSRPTRASRRAHRGRRAASRLRTSPSGSSSTRPDSNAGPRRRATRLHREGHHLQRRALLHLPRRPRHPVPAPGHE